MSRWTASMIKLYHAKPFWMIDYCCFFRHSLVPFLAQHRFDVDFQEWHVEKTRFLGRQLEGGILYFTKGFGLSHGIQKWKGLSTELDDGARLPSFFPLFFKFESQILMTSALYTISNRPLNLRRRFIWEIVLWRWESLLSARRTRSPCFERVPTHISWWLLQMQI
jgi:hypothetical protein